VTCIGACAMLQTDGDTRPSLEPYLAGHPSI
jgi:hypothetical protein